MCGEGVRGIERGGEEEKVHSRHSLRVTTRRHDRDGLGTGYFGVLSLWVSAYHLF